METSWIRPLSVRCKEVNRGIYGGVNLLVVRLKMLMVIRGRVLWFLQLLTQPDCISRLSMATWSLIMACGGLSGHLKSATNRGKGGDSNQPGNHGHFTIDTPFVTQVCQSHSTSLKFTSKDSVTYVSFYSCCSAFTLTIIMLNERALGKFTALIKFSVLPYLSIREQHKLSISQLLSAG